MRPVLTYNGSAIVDYQGHPVFWGGFYSQYTPLEYLESTGTQYIITDYILKYNSVIDCDFAFTYTSLISAILGYRQVQVLSGNVYWFGSHSNKLFARLGTGRDGTTTINLDSNFHNYQIKSDHKLYYDNSLVGNNFIVSSESTYGNMGIFTVGGVQGTDISLTKGKFRFLRIFENQQLVVDMIPVLDYNNTPCIYDRVNNKVYYNQGTGEFSYKVLSITPTEYIQLNNNEYIDTGYYPNQNTSFYIKYSIIENHGSTATCPYGTVGNITENNLDGGILRTRTPLDRVGWGTGRGSNRNINGYNNLNEIYEENYNQNIVSINGNQVAVLPNTQDWASRQSLIINGRHNSDGTIVFTPSSATYYLASVSENGVSMLELTPCTDENNTPCMYDSVRNKIIYPQTIGA